MTLSQATCTLLISTLTYVSTSLILKISNKGFPSLRSFFFPAKNKIKSIFHFVSVAYDNWFVLVSLHSIFSSSSRLFFLSSREIFIEKLSIVCGCRLFFFIAELLFLPHFFIFLIQWWLFEESLLQGNYYILTFKSKSIHPLISIKCSLEFFFSISISISQVPFWNVCQQ